MLKIRIIKTPLQKVPDWVRKQWIDLELPVDSEVSNGKNTIGYSVETNTALDILGEKSLAAMRWWEENVNTGYLPWFFFKKEICEVI